MYRCTDWKIDSIDSIDPWEIASPNMALKPRDEDVMNSNGTTKETREN
jgi:hypothetical protein